MAASSACVARTDSRNDQLVKEGLASRFAGYVRAGLGLVVLRAGSQALLHQLIVPRSIDLGVLRLRRVVRQHGLGLRHLRPVARHGRLRLPQGFLEGLWVDAEEQVALGY